jgi:hypothetical protein
VTSAPPPPGYQQQAQGYAPGYQQSGPPPVWQPPQPAHKKSHKLRWLFIAIAAFVVLIAIISAASGGSKDSKSGSNSTAKPASGASAGISKGLGSSDASADVTLGKPDASNGFSIDVPINVTNHSSKRSDYFVDISLVSADGKTQYDTALAAIQNLDPGQKSTDKASFLKLTTMPAGAKVIIKSVQRTASS